LAGKPGALRYGRLIVRSSRYSRPRGGNVMDWS
jgi:hypothetical protein